MTHRPTDSLEQVHADMTEESVIAFCGTRGVPANYGGFETAVDEISSRFVARGGACEIFCRLSSTGERLESHQGRRLVYVRGSKSLKLDTFVSAWQTGLYLWQHRKRYKHVFWFNNANFPGILMTRLAGIPMSVNTDGLEWRREKWTWPFKAYYILSSFLICRTVKRLISDSFAIQDYYRRRFFKKTEVIPYGVPPRTVVDSDRAARILGRFGLERDRYFLQITRIEPDNLPLAVAGAFVESGLGAEGYKLAVVGYRDDTTYAMQLKELDGQSGVVVIPAAYDPELLAALRTNCYCYVHGNSVGGTNPALLEAMAFCPRIAAIDSIFSREVLGDKAAFFKVSDIPLVLISTISRPDQSAQLRARVESRYQWDDVAASYLRLSQGHSADYQSARHDYQPHEAQ
jgi:glycosyltransferase involved in cell wall biosynthesis